MTSWELDAIRRAAKAEILKENFRAAVDTEKARLRAYVPVWQRIFPFTISIKRR